jgi:hypothetical protein
MEDSLPRDLTENEGWIILGDLRARFGWSGCEFSKADVQSTLDSMRTIPADLTDQEWEAIQATWEWRKGIPDQLTLRGWPLIEEAVEEVILRVNGASDMGTE